MKQNHNYNPPDDYSNLYGNATVSEKTNSNTNITISYSFVFSKSFRSRR